MNEHIVKKVLTAQQYDRLRKKYHFFKAHRLLKKSRKRMARFRDQYHGRRCFIIGNGPSLNRMDLTRLKDEITFGLNRFYLMFDKIGFCTTFLVVVNELVIEQCAGEINSLNIPKVINVRSSRVLDFDRHTLFIKCQGNPKTGPWFSPGIEKGVCTGGTVTYVAMQIAYYMGFDQVILIGVDHSFATKGEPHRVVVTQESDPNHFDPNYFGKGFRWQLPDLERSELSYRIAKFHFERNEREILDATVGGKLDIFPKVAFDSLFE